MKVLILAAGYGIRLYPYTKNYPKPLLLVNKRPVIEYLLEKLEKIEGVSEIIVVTNNRYFRHFNNWKRGLKIKNKIRIVNDLSKSPEDKLGAIKDMDFVFTQEKTDEDFLVLGGDNFFTEPLEGFISFAKKKRSCVTVGVFDIKEKSRASRYGVVSLKPSNQVVDFEEKPRMPKTTLVAMCLYYFPRTKLNLVGKYLADPKNYQDAVGSYIKWLVKKRIVYGFLFTRLWFDIGHITTYKKLNRMLLKKEG